jgi:thiol-disulfide isomerase/thioredoxin
MTDLRRTFALAIAAAFLVGACSSTAAPADPSAEPSAGPADPSAAQAAPSAMPSDGPGGSGEPTAGPTVEPDTPASGDPAVILDQPWATATLIDVATGEPFRIADLAGRTIFVEPMAIWCSKCRAQQGEFQSALARLDADRVAYVVLTIEPSETADQLARYRDQNGFEGRYAVAGTEVSAALAAEFGTSVLNPPSTPVIVVGTDGTVTLAPFGSKSADQILELAQAHGA